MTTEAASAIERVRDYHRRTIHRFGAYAAGPETLDWDAQPAPFRHYAGAPRVMLPLADDPDGPAVGRLRLDWRMVDTGLPSLPCTLEALGALFHLALGLTAWKSSGPDRWAVRANPSSGNLHPVEGWLIAVGIPGLDDGVWHYLPEAHALELRAAFEPGGAPGVHLALSSVMWREAWKYGERAFRYCQLDVGHAAAALRNAASVLGWTLTAQPMCAELLGAALGLDRLPDYPARRVQLTETEEAELLFALGCGDATGALPVRTVERWYGTASTIDAHPMYRWPVIDDMAALTRDPLPVGTLPAQLRQVAEPCGRSVGHVLLGRRSAQRFDGRHLMARSEFDGLLERLQPCAAAPWDAVPAAHRIDLVLFVHRVDGVAPGVYLLPRGGDAEGLLPLLAALYPLTRVDGLRSDLRLLATMAPPALARLSRSLHCHQDIASTSCFALGMLCEFDAALEASAAAYRALHRQAGLIGQQLYTEAEALGLRGTGIGCFFDDAVHELLGLEDERFRTLYHFTVGRAIDDARIETTPAYAGAEQEPLAA